MSLRCITLHKAGEEDTENISAHRGQLGTMTGCKRLSPSLTLATLTPSQTGRDGAPLKYCIILSALERLLVINYMIDYALLLRQLPKGPHAGPGDASGFCCFQQISLALS